jgi:uncharacterized protein DUF1592/uncharacterized protein DUF1588/uncharacterized protein DUF1595/uncharacterized protein DUF1587/uncharacterized protein DUF1585
MTRFEYDRTVFDLLGDDTHPASGFGAEEEGLGFNNNAAALITSQALTEQYMLAAEDVSERATDPIGKNLPCGVDGDGESDCADEFIASFGKRAFRRPLSADEVAMFRAQYEFGHDQDGFRLGIRMVIELALQSPAFLYRVELGVPERAEGGVMPLSSWEMASRLSYFLWGTMPDDDLFAAAEADALQTPEQIEAQARRMMQSPKARAMVGEFHRQWLDYERVANITKDASLYPDWSPAVGDLMISETSAFIEHAIFDDAGDLETLLSAPYSYMNQDLASFYGVEGPSGPDFQRVDLDPAERAGLLTLGTLLAFNSHTNQTSPTLRGKLIREQLLCDIVPPPPPDVNPVAPEITPGSTGRDRFAQHTADPACSSCHVLMDPIGFGFENFDTIGRFRSEEGGQAIDATGELASTDVDGDFDGVVELAQKLAASEDVSSCYAKQWFRYGYGRGDMNVDACTLAWLDAQFAESGGNIEELLVKLTLTDAFLYRQAGGAP